MGIKSILILGATGRTGKLIVEKALQKGLEVTVLVRHPEKLSEWQHHPKLEILKGDVLNYPDIFNAMQGNDAVISALGRDGSKTAVLNKGTANIIRAISHSRVKKFVCLSSLGAGSTKNLVGWKLKAMIWIAGLRNSFEAKAEQEMLLYQSSIDFTLVMASSLSDSNDPSAREPVSFLPSYAPYFWQTPPKISRTLVASFLLEQTIFGFWHRKTVCIVGT
ncbi:MAG: NAD(P)H-binding protein [Cytophagales bacterium]|jgi:putative NADH-flavin reductase|nr:NAD(P)H-binding protein [Cytophagales bacterium]MCA6388759.1 NAD(P)H-binding protein [Cytophagales bacterium]MCA6389850.1 NAD(P)H-binding protein [Cytophagales bacterium]MCA6393766.1 NAD(P)H-binding protein [Cytophagales bacterium]MCA6400245.1 NAD(P)H-binding protein [Cytophagales bacterium]